MNILVVGGGISGISAAKVALGEKHDVTILESTPEPGGLMARIANCRVGFKTFFDEIRDNELLSVIRDGKIVKVDRSPKEFTVILEDGRSITADKVIIATGLTPYDPVEYKGKTPRPPHQPRVPWPLGAVPFGGRLNGWGSGSRTVAGRRPDHPRVITEVAHFGVELVRPPTRILS